MSIIWSKQAKDSYFDIIDDLLIQWNIDISEDFERRVNSLLDKLLLYKKLCPEPKKVKLRKCVVHKNKSLVYRVKGNSIELVTFIDNRGKHVY